MNSIQKNILSTIITLLWGITANAQRHSDERFYDVVGLADGDEIVDALAKGIPTILIGFLIAYFTIWRKNNEEKENGKGFYFGCFGIFLIGIGFLILIPLWTWVEAIAVSAISIVFIIAILVVIVAFIYEKLK